jgi:cell wall-associated NlpC family hydrolase
VAFLFSTLSPARREDWFAFCHKNYSLMQKGIQEAARPGDLLIFFNAGKFAHLITWFSKSPFFHAAIYAGEGKVIEARPVGVVCRDIREEENFFCVPALHGSGPRALEWARRQIGDLYDIPGVAVLVLARIARRFHVKYNSGQDRFSCGQFVLCAYREAGVDLLPDMQSEVVLPSDFAVLLPKDKRRQAQKLGW